MDSKKKSNKNDGQLDLWGSSEVDIEVSLDEPENFNALDMVREEKRIIGFNILYSEFDEYFIVKSRFCNSTLSTVYDEEMPKNMTLLAQIKSIEYRTSQYGNKYAKIVFADDTGEERLYLFGKLYEKMIGKCFIDNIYILTVRRADTEELKLDIVNFESANELLIPAKQSKRISISTSISNLPELKVYLFAHMKGTMTDVDVKIIDPKFEYISLCKVNLDNENLLEMSKKGFEIKLQ